MSIIHAIYENGVFRPTEPVDLPEHAEVEFELKMLDAEQPVTKHPRRPGLLKGQVLYMAPDFNEPLDDLQEYME
ncbi:MAG: DUF104 domain-containing protein [Bacteroidales bacterium]|nr:DUF104 domain-containing protein [Bacteroidales bacterium]